MVLKLMSFAALAFAGPAPQPAVVAKAACCDCCPPGCPGNCGCACCPAAKPATACVKACCAAKPTAK